MQIISVSIDLNKLDREKIKPHANGAKYYQLTVIVNDTPDQYKNDVQVIEPQSKEERTAKAKKVFIGNGRVLFKGESRPPATNDDVPPQYNAQQAPTDGLPF